MVAFRETDEIDYYKAIEILESKGDTKQIKKLKKQGAPWYHEGNIAMKSQAFFGVLSDEMAANPNISNARYNTFEEMFGSEYRICDSLYYLLALVKTFNVVYPQLEEIDLRKTHNQLEVPVYFFEGALSYDINAPLYIAEDYYKMLECQKKNGYYLNILVTVHGKMKNQNLLRKQSRFIFDYHSLFFIFI